MARKPRAIVSKTSGQGLSRLSYQKARSLGQHGSGASGGGIKPPPNPIVKSTAGTGGGGIVSGKREYDKGDKSYTANEMRNPDLQSLKSAFKDKPPHKGKGF